MDTMAAFAMGMANKGREPKVFDWIKAAEIIKERNPVCAIAGLEGDMGYTAGEIWKDGAPVRADETYTYLASNWATPILEIDGEEIECYKKKSETPNWDAETYWPDEALAIINDK